MRYEIFLRTLLGSFLNARYFLKTFKITETLFELITNKKHVLLKFIWHYSQYLNLCRCESWTAATSKMEYFVIIVNGFQRGCSSWMLQQS